MSLITVHYRNVKHPDRDIQVIPVWGKAGQRFDVGPYLNDTPSADHPCYFDSLPRSASAFKIKPQDVVIMVRNYLLAKILFKDATNHKRTVGRYRLRSRHASQTLNYQKIGRGHMPRGYRFLSPVAASFDPENDAVFVPNATEVIYVRPRARSQKMNSDPRLLVTGYLNYVDVDDQCVKKTVPISGPKGKRIDYSRYRRTDQLPAGYRCVKASARAAALEPGRAYTIWIQAKSRDRSRSVQRSGVPKKKSTTQRINLTSRTTRTTYYQAPSSEHLRGTVLYQDLDNNELKEELTVTGPKGKSIRPYLTSKYLPAGYHFIKLQSDYGTRLEPNAVYLVLIRAASPHNDGNKRPRVNPVTGYVVYRDRDTGKVIETVPVTSTRGTKMDYRRYISSNEIPQGYRFAGLDNRNPADLQPRRRYLVWIRKPNRSRHSPLRTRTTSWTRTTNSRDNNGKRTRQTNYDVHRNSAQPEILPRADEEQQGIGAALMALGSSLSALGRALNRRR